MKYLNCHQSSGVAESLFSQAASRLISALLYGEPQQKKSTDAANYTDGSLPLLLLAWLCTEAVRTQSRELILGSSLQEFMRELGM